MRVVSDLFVDFNTNGALGDVPDTTGTTMVELVRHTLVDRTVHFHIDVIADLECPKVGRQWDCTLLPEPSSKQIPRPRANSMTRRHFSSSVECDK